MYIFMFVLHHIFNEFYLTIHYFFLFLYLYIKLYGKVLIFIFKNYTYSLVRGNYVLIMVYSILY